MEIEWHVFCAYIACTNQSVSFISLCSVGEGARGRDQYSGGSRYKERRDRKKEEKKVKWNQVVNFNAVPRKRESHTLNIGPKRGNHHRKPPVDKQLCLQSRYEAKRACCVFSLF